MKRIPAVIALTAALSFGVSAHAQTSFADVPAGHWAQEAIKRAVDCGIILGYPDGTFRGKQAITRYEAAAMIGRLLDAVAQGKCGLPGSGAPVEMDTAAMEALQNAVQELSADLADQGVRISELEDNAVSQDDLSRVEELATEARDLAQAASDAADANAGGEAGVSAEDFAALQDQVASVEELAQEARDLAEAAANNEGTDYGADIEAINELIAQQADQVEAAGIAADTALAQSRDLQDSVDALNGRVDDLESQLGELGATVEGQADSIAALNDLVVLLNEDVLSLQDRVSALEGQIEDVNAQFEDINAQLETTASADDLEALREFTTLLRRDQTALADRVSDLEARVGATEKKNADQDARLDVLEANGFTVSGSIGLSYYTARTWRDGGTGVARDFDIDRLGLANNFSSGQDEDKDNGATTYADFSNGYALGDFDSEDNAKSLAGVNNKGSLGEFRINGDGILLDSDFKIIPSNDPSPVTAAKGTTDPTKVADPTKLVRQANNIRQEGKLTTSFSLVLTFKQRNAVEASKGYQSFPLVLTINADVTSGAPDNFLLNGDSALPDTSFKIKSIAAKYLVGASPLTIDYGVNPSWKFAKYVGANADGRGNGFVATADAGFLGLKLTGVYGSNGDKAKTLNGDFRYFRGVKGEASVIPGLTGGAYYLEEDADVLGANATSGVIAYGLTASGKLLGLLGIEGEYSVSDQNGPAKAFVAGYVNADASLGIFGIKFNYRTVDLGWSKAQSLGGDDYPYKGNQNGFGVEASINGLFNFLSLSAKYDSRSVKDISANLPNGPLADTVETGVKNASQLRILGGFRLIGFNIEGLFNMDTEDGTGSAGDGSAFGIRALHDGSKDDALLKGVNLGVGYGMGLTDSKYKGSGVYAYFDTSLDLGGFNIKPKAYITNATVGTDAVNSLGFGLNLTASLFGAKLNAGVAYDASAIGANKDATTLWYTVGISFEQFLLPNSNFSVAYASRTDTNRNGTGFGPGWGTISGTSINPFSDIAKGWGAPTTGAGQVEQGLLFTFGYYGLDFKYGIFSIDPAGAETLYWGNAFSMSYKLKF
jgi:predicted  nucleic acid-binding Zn-ribbon protein